MKQTWRYSDVNLCCETWNVEKVLDGIGVPDTRGENTLVPFQRGRRPIKKMKDHKTIILAMWVRGINPDNPLEISSEWLEKNKDRLTKLFGSRGLHVLERTLPGGEKREALAEVIVPINFLNETKTSARFTVEFLIPAGIFTGPTDVTYTLSAADLQHAGTAPQDSMTITMTGPLVNPKLENKTNDIWLQYLGTLVTGESLVIKTADYSVTKADQNMIPAFRHGGDASWFILEPGANELELTTDGAGGSVTIAFKPAYY